MIGVSRRNEGNDPSLIYVIPNEHELRESGVTKATLHGGPDASLLGGEIYATDTIDGAALWIRLDRELFGSLHRIRMQDTRDRNPAVKDRCHSIPRQHPLLTALEHQPPSRYPTDVK